MESNHTPSDLLNTMCGKISEVMAFMDMFQPSRSGSIAFTKLEEALMWLQVLTHNVPLKPKNEEVSEVKEGELLIAQ